MRRKMLLVLGLTIPAFISLLRPGIHPMQDSMQYFRIYEMRQCVMDGQIPCRWVPDLGYGFGYPLFIYYSPLPYYLGTGLTFFGFGTLEAIKILFILGFLVSAAGMYWLIWELTKNGKAAIVGSMLYTYVPVRAVEVYVRGSLGEFLALAFVPWIGYFSLKIIRGNEKRNIGYLAFWVFGLLTTHNLMSLAFIPVLGILTGFWLWGKPEKIKEIGIGWILGVSAGAFYLLPLIFERNYVHLESMIGGFFGFREHFVSLNQLFWERVWGYGSSGTGGGVLSLSLGHVHWIGAAVVGGITGLNIGKKRPTKLKGMIILATLLAGVFAFLMHRKSSFIWDSFSGLAFFQFPWRFLVVEAFLLSLIISLGISAFDKTKGWWLVGGAVAVILLAYGPMYRPKEWLDVREKDLLTAKEFEKQQTASIFDYLPVAAVKPPNYRAKNEPEILEGEGRVTSYVKGSDWQAGQIVVDSQSAVVRIPMFDFPGMRVWNNGQPVKFGHDECGGQDYCFGQISFRIGAGVNNIKIKLTKTWPRLLGDVISLCSLAVGLGWIIKNKKYEKNRN